MAGFRVTKAAERDLVSIARHTLKRWGEEQTRDYLGQLDTRFRELAQRPDSGRRCDEVRNGYRRFQQGKHVIFYRIRETKIVDIVRVLHERMLPEMHL